MAAKMTLEKIKLRYQPGLYELYDGDRYYRFYQREYWEDFTSYFTSSAKKTYDKIAELFIDDEEGKDCSRTVERYQKLLLFGGTISSFDMGRRLTDMLFALQENEEFNPRHHVYIDEIESHKETKFSYKWDDTRSKWHDIVEYSDSKKNRIIAGCIYELLDIMSESDFYNLKMVDQTDAENGYYDDRIREIYTIIDELYIDNLVLNEKWTHILNPIKNLIHRHEFPGIYDEVWIRNNEAIVYFDVAFDIAESNPEVFELVNNGNAGVRFSIEIDQDMIKRRKQYIQNKTREDAVGNAHRSRLQLLEEELKLALKRILVNEFEAL